MLTRGNSIDLVVATMRLYMQMVNVSYNFMLVPLLDLQYSHDCKPCIIYLLRGNPTDSCSYSKSMHSALNSIIQDCCRMHCQMHASSYYNIYSTQFSMAEGRLSSSSTSSWTQCGLSSFIRDATIAGTNITTEKMTCIKFPRYMHFY